MSTINKKHKEYFLYKEGVYVMVVLSECSINIINKKDFTAHTPYLFYFKITSQFLTVCSAQYMGSKLTKFKCRVCSWTIFDICLISFYFISLYCYDCLITNLLIHFVFRAEHTVKNWEVILK
jgi:hypothetical protein